MNTFATVFLCVLLFVVLFIGTVFLSYALENFPVNVIAACAAACTFKYVVLNS